MCTSHAPFYTRLTILGFRAATPACFWNWRYSKINPVKYVLWEGGGVQSLPRKPFSVQRNSPISNLNHRLGRRRQVPRSWAALHFAGAHTMKSSTIAVLCNNQPGKAETLCTLSGLVRGDMRKNHGPQLSFWPAMQTVCPKPTHNARWKETSTTLCTSFRLNILCVSMQQTLPLLAGPAFRCRHKGWKR